MKKLYSLLTALVLTTALGAQTLNISCGAVTYRFPAAQAGDMTYSDGSALTGLWFDGQRHFGGRQGALCSASVGLPAMARL